MIEDSEPLLNDIVEMLSLEGFETLQAENGEVGIKLVEDHQPDLIVCDVRMPVMDGYKVLDHLRSNRETANIPFIFLTARTGRKERLEGMQLGADDYLTKPFTAEELITTVHSRLARNHSFHTEVDRQMDMLRRSIILALPHELRTPLNAILGFSEIMIADSEILTRNQVYEMSEHINEAALRLYRLIENYVVYANLELLSEDEVRLENLRKGRTEYPAISIAQHVEDQARRQNRMDDLQLTMAEGCEPVAMDGDNLAKVVQELMDNALKFSKPGTAVEVIISCGEDGLNLVITDYGVGMSSTEIRSIGAYMQFQRAFLEQQGIGFGLYISQRIVELHNGRFDIRSAPSQFTTIDLTIPFAKPRSNGFH
ncbi:MAG: response regulator [Chloroflexota bacterium]